MADEARTRRWLTGLRRAWTASGALERWISERGVTGVVWTPAGYETDDLAPALLRLVEAGAKPDASLLWDLALDDLRRAADALRGVLRSSSWTDGFVAVWLDPARLGDPERAFAAAGDLAIDMGGRPNIAAAFAWSGSRAAVVERLVAAGMPLALSGVRDEAGALSVAAAKERGMARRLKEAAEALEEGAPPPEVPDVPVFLLGSPAAPPETLAVTLVGAVELVRGEGGGGRLPTTAEAERAALAAAVERLGARSREPLRDDAYAPLSFARAIEIECRELDRDEVLDDIWARDHEVWKDDPTEISNRLGWLDVADCMREEAPGIRDWARGVRRDLDLRHVVLCGMGGSSLAASTFAALFGTDIAFTVLDTTHPDHIRALTQSLDLDRTLFVVSSKSGTTVETRAHLEYLWSLVSRGDRFVAVTDPGTPLAALAAERGFRRVFENPPDIGGRYSALSYFGLVPAALAGIDPAQVLAPVRRQVAANAPGVAALAAPGVRLGAAVGEAARREGRDKLTIVLPPPLAAFGHWVEQLVAESTGKEGTGVLPVVGEELGPPEVYGSDRLFVVYMNDEYAPPQLEALETSHPVVSIRGLAPELVGAEMFRWEMAIAVTGYELDVNPFDQPDVEAAKERTREVLDRGGGNRPDPGSAAEVLEGIEPPRYIAIQAFLAPTTEHAARLARVRQRLRDRYRVAVTAGFGPPYLHSTGQYHKGGPPTGAFLQVTEEAAGDLEIPGMGLSFGQLLAAQADGDLVALRERGRPVARLSLSALEELCGRE